MEEIQEERGPESGLIDLGQSSSSPPLPPPGAEVKFAKRAEDILQAITPSSGPKLGSARFSNWASGVGGV